MDQIRDVAHWCGTRDVGERVRHELQAAVNELDYRGDAALSVDRILETVQASAAPLPILRGADETWGTALDQYGQHLSDLQARGRALTHEAVAARTAVVGSAPEGTPAALARERLLSELDAERVALDAQAQAQIDGTLALFMRIRNHLPVPPQVSGAIRVRSTLSNGQTQRVSAWGLGRLQDPQRIAEVWRGISAADQERLIADAPLLIGNLQGIPLRERDRANRLTTIAYRNELEARLSLFDLVHEQPAHARIFEREQARIRAEIRSLDALLGDRNAAYRGVVTASGERFGEYRIFQESGADSTQAGVLLVETNPLRDSWVTYHGPLDAETGGIAPWVQHIGVLVPGTNSKLSTLTSDLDRTKDLVKAGGASTAFFTWRGARMPEFDVGQARITDAAAREFAETAGPRLASFMNTVERPPGAELVPIGHSYGAAVVGRAELLGARADSVMYVAPAGLGHGATTIADFPHTATVPHFVLQARNDGVVGWNQGSPAAAALGLGHGIADPLATPGVTRLETGFLDIDHESLGAIESVGAIEAHSSVFAHRSTALHSITSVLRGEPVWAFTSAGPTVVPPEERVMIPSRGAR